MRRLFRSRPLVAAILALHLSLFGGQACAMTPSGHEHEGVAVAPGTATPAGIAVAGREAHAHHAAPGSAAIASSDGWSAAPASPAGAAHAPAPDGRPDADHDGERCAAATACGTAPLASGAIALLDSAAPAVVLVATTARHPRSTTPEPDSPPPRG